MRAGRQAPGLARSAEKLTSCFAAICDLLTHRRLSCRRVTQESGSNDAICSFAAGKGAKFMMMDKARTPGLLKLFAVC